MADKVMIQGDLMQSVKKRDKPDPKKVMLEICQQEPVTRADVYEALWGLIDDGLLNLYHDKSNNKSIFMEDADYDDDDTCQLTNKPEVDFEIPDGFWKFSENSKLVVDCPFCDETQSFEDGEYEVEEQGLAQDNFKIPSDKMCESCDVRLDTGNLNYGNQGWH